MAELCWYGLHVDWAFLGRAVWLAGMADPVDLQAYSGALLVSIAQKL